MNEIIKSREESKGYTSYYPDIFVMKSGTVKVKMAASLPDSVSKVSWIFPNAIYGITIDKETKEKTLRVYDSCFEDEETAIVLLKCPFEAVESIEYIR